MTAFNREQFIAEAIDSVLASTYENWELIILDDCSSDATFEIAKKYAESESRIFLFRNKQNLGDYPNRNKAASYATGKYIKFVDSDDRIFPETLRIMVELMEEFTTVGFGLSDISASVHQKYPLQLDSRSAYLFHYFERPIFFASPGLAIFNRRFFEAVGGFPEKRMVGDFEMWHKLAQTNPVILMPGNLYWIRRHDGQEVSDQNKFILDYESIKINYLFARESPLTVCEAREIVRRRRLTVLKIFFRKLVAWQIGEACLRLRVFMFYLRSGKKLRAQI